MRTTIALFLLLSATAPSVRSQVSAHYLGIGRQGQARLLATDSAGNLYAVANVIEPSGRPQIRVIKTDPQVNVLATATFGSSQTDALAAAAVDHQGNLIITGSTYAPDFPLVPPLASNTASSSAFVTKLDPQLHILFSTRLGGAQPSLPGTTGGGLALDSAGNIYLTGSTSALDFPVTAGAYQTTPPMNDPFGNAVYAYVTKLSADGSRILFSTYFGSNTTNCSGGSSCLGVHGTSAGSALALDSSGAIILAGTTTASDLPTTAGAYAQQCNGCGRGGSAGFLAKFSADGTRLLWATYLPLADRSHSERLASSISILTMALDASGNIVVGGPAPVGFPVTSGAAQTEYSASAPFNFGVFYGGFVSKFDPTAQHLLFSTYLGGNVLLGGINGVLALAPDSQGNIWLAGGSVPDQLPLPAGTPILGQTYFGALASDGSRMTAAWTAPTGAAGQALVLTSQAVATLGSAGSILLAGPSSGASLLGVANSAGSQVSGYVAPYELISFYGSGLGPATPAGPQVADGLVSTSLSDVQVLFDGTPAPLLYVSSTQVNAIVPSMVNGRNSTAVRIVTPSGAIDGLRLLIRPSRPEVFRS
ncbi:MAG TPA: SBBP repeat-containing protein, partial [Bryobacteraceae bacterium]|nr:SBBP repeat-containing protein [Bryobacteraceae bacterium]